MAPDQTLRLAFLADPNETHTRRWLSYFAAAGHHVELLVKDEVELEAPLPPGIELRRIPPYGRRRFAPLGYLDGRRALRRAIREARPDVLHVHYLTGYGWLAWISGFRPYVITVWGSDVFRTLPASAKARAFGRLALRRAALVTADSRDLARAAIAAGARPSRTTLIQFGVDTGRFAPGTPADGIRSRLPAGARVVFAPRTLLPLYRQDLVVRALPSLPDDVVVVMSAKHADRACLASVEALATDLGVRGRLHLEDAIAHDDMADWYRASDVVVSIPETDGTPVSILEALACGVPVVASDVPSAREWLGGVWPELMVPVGDETATAAAIRTALGVTADGRARRGAAGRALVVQRADYTENMQTMERAYRRLALRRGADPGSTPATAEAGTRR